ncbi:polysaccharide deacetylase family protein [Lachnoclostridium edouardi]|uniref:polysaccharide deacetylase family protein n=1 Tax=Lachnoclostridium edouardi TaxID=1926283 RepID=UPI001FA9201F|nr:polysaccharide deacetylase family protein [Lachnoclostridium edouardi]
MKIRRLAAAMAITVLGSIALSATAWAAVASPRLTSFEWIDEEQGPGVAMWVDENGNISEPLAGGPAQENTEENTEGQQTAEEAAAAEAQKAAEEAAAAEAQKAAEEAAAAEAQKAAEAAAAAQAGGRVIDPARPMVALTFDDGPMASVGNQIMDCLAQYGGKATFYVVGNRCASYVAEMQRMVAEGHEIGNHTYEHKYLNKLNTAQIRAQIDKGADAVQAVCGVRPKTVRLPGGNKNATVLSAVQEPIVLWSIDTLDWKTKNAQSTVNKVLSNVKDGDIVLMHELYSATGQAALQLIPELTNRGYQLVTVSEMAQYRGGLQNGQIYYSIRP